MDTFHAAKYNFHANIMIPGFQDAATYLLAFKDQGYLEMMT